MIRRIFLKVFAIFFAIFFCSCFENQKLVKVQPVDSGVSVMTTADVRAIHHIKVENENQIGGRIKPKYIVCAEPSPDIAKAVADALNIGTSFDIKGLPSGIDPKVAAEISKARAQSVAQLTERLATIQLLRDTLYRACESYANGAITSTAYTIMLSRYDDIMITMLLGEFAAGGFGRSLAAIGTEAAGNSLATSNITGKSDNVSNSEKKLGELKKQQDDLKAKLESAIKQGKASDDPMVKELNSKIEANKKMIDQTKDQLLKDLETERKSYAKALTVTGVGGITPSRDAEIAKTLATMQRKYIENINTDALEVACITKLSEDTDATNPIIKYCDKYIDESLKFKLELLKQILSKGAKDKMQEEIKTREKDLVKNAKEYIEEIKNLLDQVKQIQ